MNWFYIYYNKTWVKTKFNKKNFVRGLYKHSIHLEIAFKLFFFRFVETYRIISRHRVRGTNAISTGDSFLLPFRKIACTRPSASDVIKWLSRPRVDKRVSRVGVSRSSRPIKPRSVVFAASIIILHPLSYFFASFPVLPVSRVLLSLSLFFLPLFLDQIAPIRAWKQRGTQHLANPETIPDQLDRNELILGRKTKRLWICRSKYV